MRKTIIRKTGRGGNNKKRIKKFIRKMTSKIKVDSKTIRNAVKYDLKLKSNTRMLKHQLTTVMKEKIFERRKKFTTWLNRNPSDPFR